MLFVHIYKRNLKKKKKNPFSAQLSQFYLLLTRNISLYACLCVFCQARGAIGRS